MAVESSSEARSGPLSLVSIRDALWRLIVSTVATCMRNRVTGLAAEAAFFAILSLPPLIFALAGSIGYVFAQFSDSQIDEVRNTVLSIAGQALTPQTVNSIIRPTLNEVLDGGGRYDVISIGFVLALCDLEPGNVVPRAHRHATVDRDRPHRRMRKHEPQRWPIRVDEFRHDRREIIAVGTEAMQPDHRVAWIASGFLFDARQRHEWFPLERPLV